MTTVVVQKTTNVVSIERTSPQANVTQAVNTALDVSSTQTLVKDASSTPRVINVAAPGPQGAPGVDGADGSTTDMRTAATTLSGHRVVRSVTASQVGYASAADADHGDDTIGITLGAALAGEPVEVQRIGSLTHNGWSWTPGEPVFLGADGLLTQVEPDDTYSFVQVIGHAEAADTIYVQIERPLYY